MKLIVCVLFVIANISNNGKASLDSLVPMSTNILFEDTTKNADKSCYRPCKFNVKPRKCYYQFKIEPTILEDGRPALTVNGMTPGPPIHVCANDIVVVEVKNKVVGQDMAIHWHGVEQKGTPYMDGVPMVTQCPISYGSSFKYAFRASSPGTFFYHADSVRHQSDGVYGALIVNQPQPLEAHSSLYDFDRSQENTLIVAAKFPELITPKWEDSSQLKPSSLLVNGQEEDFKIFVLPSFAYRLRLINAIAIECPVEVTVDGREMVVIATDGKPVKPVSTSRIQLYPGERMDVVVRASEKMGGNWVRVRGDGACRNLSASAMLLRLGFNYTAMLVDGKKETFAKDSDSGIQTYGQNLESIQDVSNSIVDRSLILSIDRHVLQFKDTDNDYRYISDAIPKKPFFPASLSLADKGVVQINHKSFLYPNVPLLVRPNDVKKEIKCSMGEKDQSKDPQCLLALNAHPGEILELVLLNEGFGSNDSYTFHMHGYSMQIVATMQGSDGKPISKETFEQLDNDGKIKRNIQTPPLKDTVTVPNKGFTIVRIILDRGGSWLLECRSCSLALPAALVVNVPESLPKSLVDSFPKCGDYKPPDVLLH
ncbi:uncharacterized protein LOC134742378 [Cydia strobilella]|uniref:uncharacterized protein LOC134742378 n=1 Tax=Cydia strobilella TaxID=1100964 RepID=UPI003006E5B7